LGNYFANEKSLECERKIKTEKFIAEFDFGLKK